MNMGIVTSYVIAGILLLSILAMNLNLTSSSAELSMYTVKQTHMESLVEVISSDIPKMGYNRTATLDSAKIIQKADSTELRFYSNIDNSADETVETVRWTLGAGDNGTPNPNDQILTRTILFKGTVNEKTDIKMGITRFRINYYSQPGSTTPMAVPVANADLDKIKQIEVIIQMQTANRVKPNPVSSGQYLSTLWSKRFTPPNVNNN